MRPGSGPYMVIVPPPKQAWKWEAILLFKKGGVLQHICVCEIISIKFVGERGREIETNRETERERLDPISQLALDSLQHAHQPTLHSHWPGNLRDLVSTRMVKARRGTSAGNQFTKMLAKAIGNPLSHYMLHWAFLCREASLGVAPMEWHVGTAAVHLDLEGRDARAWTAAGI